TELYTLSLHDALPISQRHLVGDHERRVEADAELPDQALRGRGVLGLLDLLQQGRGPGLGDGADQLHHLVPGHPDAVVADGQRTRSEEHTSELQSPYDL